MMRLIEAKNENGGSVFVIPSKVVAFRHLEDKTEIYVEGINGSLLVDRPLETFSKEYIRAARSENFEYSIEDEDFFV